MVQHGEFLDLIPEAEVTDLVCLSDMDMVVQRDMTLLEHRRFKNLGMRDACMLLNRPGDTLKDEAERINLDLSIFCPEAARLSCHNCGVIIGRVGLFESLRKVYAISCGNFYQMTQHRSRCQFLMNWCLKRVMMVNVKDMPREIHTHGHFGIPEDAKIDDEGRLTYKNKVVMFRHKI
jgi:hypothetical protein